MGIGEESTILNLSEIHILVMRIGIPKKDYFFLKIQTGHFLEELNLLILNTISFSARCMLFVILRRW